MSDAVRVLVVDEDPDVREITKTFLEREGDNVHVETVASGEDALSRLAADAFDAVVSDYRMPGLDGLELATTLAERHPQLTFVLFSAADDPVTEEAVADAAVDEFVLKGSGTDHFGSIVDAIKTGGE